MKKILMTVAAMAAACAFGNVFDDCVYWFCGGRDSNGDGFLQSGETIDTMHANDASHNAHKCTVYGWSNVSGMQSLGAQLREEDVFCPAQGVTNRTMCIFLPQSQEYVDNGDGTVTTNYCNNAVLFNNQLISFLPTNVFTCVMRLRRERKIGNEWTVPLFGGRTVPPNGTPKYDFAARAAAAKAPAFPADAEVIVAEIDDGHRRDKSGRKIDPKPRKQVVVSFPPIVTGAASPSRGFDFSVTAEMRVADMTQVIQEKRVFSPNVYMAEEEDVEPVTCAFARADIPKRRDVRFVVRPIDCWGKKGAPIASPWRRFGAST